MPNTPWNKGRIVGQKSALTYDQVRAIRTILASGNVRDRALFAVAINSSLREGDLLDLRVKDVQSADGEIKSVIVVLPAKTRKTGVTISFEPTEDTVIQLKALIKAHDLYHEDFLFTRQHSKTRPTKPLSTKGFQNLVKKWVAAIGLDAEAYGTHSLRRTRPAYIYANTGNLRACQVILGHKSITTTQEYLGINTEEALEISRRWQM